MARHTANSPSRPSSRKDWWNGYAFLGYGHKDNDVWHSVFGDRLTCGLKRSHYVTTIAGAIFIGPILTAASIVSLLTEPDGKAKIIQLIIGVFGCLLLYNVILTRTVAVVDRSTGILQLFNRRGSAAIVSVDMSAIGEVKVESFYRTRELNSLLYDRIHHPEECSLPVYEVHEVALHLTDGRCLSLVETPNLDVAEAIAGFIAGGAKETSSDTGGDN